MEKALKKGFSWGGRLILPVVFFTCLLYSGAFAVGVVDVPLNQAVTAQTSASPVDEASCPKKLWQFYGKGYKEKFHAQVYRFTVKPGEKYSFYGYFPPDGIYRNAYLRGDNPLTNYTSSWGDTQGVSTGFVFWFQQPHKWQCPAVTRRVNITISPRSSSPYLYVIATSMAPRLSFRMMMKSPADPDTDVEKNTVDPSCPPKKSSTWGQVWGSPILVRYDPSEQGKTTVVTPPPVVPPPPPTQPTGVGPQTPAQTGTVAAVSTPYGQTSSLVPQGAWQWIEYVKSGRTFWVHFDMTMNKFNDSNFTGDWRTDPMGTLQGGQVYEVAFRNGKFTCTGYNQANRRVETHAYGGINPEDGLISLWGRTYAFDGKGQVWDQDYGSVGNLRLSP